MGETTEIARKKNFIFFFSSICHKNCVPTVYVFSTSADFIFAGLLNKSRGEGKSQNDARKMVECNLYDVYGRYEKKFLVANPIHLQKSVKSFCRPFVCFFYDSLFYSFFSSLVDFFSLGVAELIFKWPENFDRSCNLFFASFFYDNSVV